MVYNKEIIRRMDNVIPQSITISVQEAIFSGDNEKLKSIIQEMLTESISCFDASGENLYHGFMLGLCVAKGGTFISSNKESGDGRYNIQLKPRSKSLPGIIIEFKVG